VNIPKEKRFACNCDDWKENMPKIDAAMTVAQIHGAPYTGARFEFCPWCGWWLLRNPEDAA